MRDGDRDVRERREGWWTVKVRIQHVLGGQWFDLCERVITERRSRTVRVPAVGEYARTFSISTGKVLYEFENYRIHPDDVPALASLPLRLAKTKPFDLDAHPLAPVLRRVVVMVADATGQIGGDPDYALDAIQDTAIVRDAETCEVLTSCAALALAGLAALDKPKGGA